MPGLRPLVIGTNCQFGTQTRYRYQVLRTRCQGEDAGQRDADPGGTIVEFVEQLVECLFQQVGVEQAIGLRGLWGELWVGRDGGAPGVEEFGGDGVLPELGPGLQRGGVGLALTGPALGKVIQASVGSVAEGAKHAGDILERRLLGAAFGERACGLALEVEDDVVAAGAEDLAEVVVAVDTDAQASLAGGRRRRRGRGRGDRRGGRG